MTLALSDIKIEIADVQPCVKKLIVEIPASHVALEAEKKWRDVIKSAKVQGFRPGKAPRPILEKLYGGQVLGEVGEKLIHQSFQQAVNGHSLEVFGNPSFEDVKVEKGQPLTYSAVIEIFPKLDVPSCGGWAFDREIRKVDEKEIEAVFNQLRDKHAELVPVEGRGVKDGDFVFMDYSATVDGKEEPKLSGKGQQMIVNTVEDTLFVEFHRNVAGMKAGEEKEFTMSVSKQYPDPALADKQAAFKVKVTAAKEKKLPELNDDLIIANTPHGGVEEMRKDLRAHAEKRAQQGAEDGLRRNIMRKFRESASFPLPPKMLAQYGEMYANRLIQQTREWGLDLTAQPDFDREKFKQNSMEKGEEWARDEVIIENLAKAHGLKPDEAELERLQGLYAEHLKSDDQDTRYNAAVFTIKEALRESVFKFINGKITINDKIVEGEVKENE